MTDDKDIKKAIIDLLKAKYPQPPYSYYGIEVVEGYTPPAFFVDLRPRGMTDETINVMSRGYDVYIKHFPRKVDEAAYLDIIREVTRSLTAHDKRKRKPRMTLKVGERYIKVDEFGYDYVGKNGDILQIEWNMTFYDFIEDGPQYEVMKELEISESIEQGGNT
jgi:hypothetical protein